MNISLNKRFLQLEFICEIVIIWWFFIDIVCHLQVGYKEGKISSSSSFVLGNDDWNDEA